MIIFKFIFIYSDAKIGRPILQPGGHWKLVSIDELPETDKELKFSQIKNLDRFVLKLIENPFDNLNLNSELGRKYSNEEKTIPFKLVFIELEFWSKFNDSLYQNLTLALDICDDKFNWPIKNLEKQKMFKEFDSNYIESKFNLNKSNECLSDFKFSIINGIKENEFKIEELNILYLGVYYSTVSLNLSDLIESNELNNVWSKIEDNYESTRMSASKTIRPPIKYECKLEDCKSFLINSKEIKNRMFYPKINSNWINFYESRETDELFSLTLNEDLELVSNYTIEFFYFITKNCKLRIFTSLNNNSLITLHPSYSYQLENELFKWLPVIINLKDILPFSVNSVKGGFKIYIQTIIEDETVLDNEFQKMFKYAANSNKLTPESQDLELAAITNIELNSGDYHKQKLTDFLTSWNSNGRKAINEWTCLIDNTEFYGGYQQKDELNNNISIIFYAPKFKSKSTYLLISKWFRSNDQVFEIKISSELKSHLLIETFDENLNILNEKQFKLNKFEDIYYDVMYPQKHPQYYKSQIYEKIKYEKLNYQNNNNLNENEIVRLRLSFHLDNLDDENQPKKLLIKNINMADPCNDENLCIFSNECVSLSSTEYKCKCIPFYHGKRCEFIDLCANKSIGGSKCEVDNFNSTCVPIGDSFRCDCSNSGRYWVNDYKQCDKIPFCYTKKGLIDNQCVYNHHEHYDLNVNHTFECNKQFEVDSYILKCKKFEICKTGMCSSEESCISSIQPEIVRGQTSICVCDLRKGYLNLDTGCVPINDTIKLLFVKQLLNCSQTYEIEYLNTTINDSKTIELFYDDDQIDLINLKDNSDVDKFKMKCSCFNGYKLDTNQMDCVLNNETEECTKECDFKNQLCTFDEFNNQTCKCEMGYYGENCTINFCENSENYEYIKSFCGEFGCNSTDGENQTKFICNCDDRYYYTDYSTGLCKIKDICTDEIEQTCKTLNATCMPTINFTTNSLIYDCVCPQGWKMDELTNRCYEMCKFYDYNNLINKRCFVNLTLKTPEFLCKPGFYPVENVCILSQKDSKFEIDFVGRINMDEDLYLKFNSIKNIKPNLTNLNCEKNLDPIGCIEIVNKSYLKLEQISNRLQIHQAFIYSFTDLISISLQSILGDDLFNAQILGFEIIDNVSSILDVNQSEEVNYSSTENPTDFINFLDSNRLENQTDPTVDIIDEIRDDFTDLYDEPYFKLLKFKIYLETSGFFDINHDLFFKDCDSKLCPLHPYLHVVNGSFKSKKLKLNETDYLIECFPGSSPIFEKFSNSLFRCSCNKGYSELARILMSSKEIYFKAICLDIDECLRPELNECDLNTTECVNYAGGYKCKCLNSNYFQKDNFSCYLESELNFCDSETTYFNALPNFECTCKNKTLIKMDNYTCYDPCIDANCSLGKCLPHSFDAHNIYNNDSYVCVYDENESKPEESTTKSDLSTTLLIILILWTITNSIMTIIILYKFGYLNRFGFYKL